ncbi:hypothetical protein AAHA92_04847 [Salvia divinorum]|uniref:Uncharacterized protein n=1 Tax=Salvia divinorum TaxID=28513 RepID=A0ABD1I1T5_SALDI
MNIVARVGMQLLHTTSPLLGSPPLRRRRSWKCLLSVNYFSWCIFVAVEGEGVGARFCSENRGIVFVVLEI